MMGKRIKEGKAGQAKAGAQSMPGHQRKDMGDGAPMELLVCLLGETKSSKASIFVQQTLY